MADEAVVAWEAAVRAVNKAKDDVYWRRLALEQASDELWMCQERERRAARRVDKDSLSRTKVKWLTTADLMPEPQVPAEKIPA